jgi:trehalose 6-phosphate synthase
VAVRRKLIVVSNRAPVTFGRDESGDRVARRGGGGLVTALRGLVQHHDVTWIASAMSDEDRVVAEEAGGAFEETVRDGSTFRLRLVVHDPEEYDGYYNVVSNGMLWFLQHYLWGLASTPDIGPVERDAWHHGYEPVNRDFADAVVAELDATPGSAVCFHDYHLYLAPRAVRELRPDALLTHFVHIPWAEPDYWRVLPADLRCAVHEGLLANDVVGFHTDRWRQSFLEGCEQLLCADCERRGGVVRHRGRQTRIVTHPISIDVEEFAELREDDAVLREERLIAETRPELLVLRVDRTDPSKNIVRGFRAYALFLERHPELHGRVGMLALLHPSRQSVPVYAEYIAAIEREVAAVNDRFGTAVWRPVDLQLGDNFPQAVAAYKQFDAVFVNPIFDGMNLVAKEAPFVNERDGVVVLSENAGAHEELGAWALTVNPFDLESQAEALHRALTMPEEERRRRAAGLKAQVREHDIEEWIESQLEEIDRFAEIPSV